MTDPHCLPLFRISSQCDPAPVVSLHIVANAIILHLTPFATRTILAVTGVMLQYYQVSTLSYSA